MHIQNLNWVTNPPQVACICIINYRTVSQLQQSFFQWAMDVLQVCLLGTIDKNRLHTDDEDVESVLNDHEPSNVSDLTSRRILGCSTFIISFCPLWQSC